MTKPVRTTRETGHRSSAPLHPGAGTGPGEGHILDSYGGPTLAVSDNANIRADGFKADSQPVHNVSPALVNPRKTAFYEQRGRGGIAAPQTAPNAG